MVDWETRAREHQARNNRSYYLWKTFEISGTGTVPIKSYIGLPLFGIREERDTVNPDTVSDTSPNTYYENYDNASKTTIDEIFQQLKIDENRITLAHTYLYLSLEDRKVCIFRQLMNSGEVNFIDNGGRLYTSWEHFVDTNELPECDYVAPINGIHNVYATLNVYESPTKRLSSQVLRYGDIAVAGITFGALGLGVIGTAPLTAATLGATGVVYDVGRRIGLLCDRSAHNQSIALWNNFDSFLSWLSIGSASLTGAAAVGLSNASRILKLSGQYNALAAGTLRSLYYATLVSNAVNFGVYTYYLRQRYLDGELSSLDVLELCAQLFLIYGAVTNVRQMHQYLTTLDGNTTPKKLSKSAKRRLRRMRARIRNNGGTIRADVVEVGTLEGSFSQWSPAFSSSINHVLMHCAPVAHRIFHQCREIIETVRNFRRERLTVPAFIENMRNHAYNLYILYEEKFISVRQAISESSELMANYFTTASTQFVTNITAMVDHVVGYVHLNEEDTDDSTDDSSPTPPIDCRPKYEIILDVVKQRVCNLNYNSEDSLKEFAKELSLLISHIEQQVEVIYNEMISFYRPSLGEENATKCLSRIGINSKSDYADYKFSTIIETLRTVQSNDSVVIERLLNRLFGCYKELFLLATNDGDLSKVSLLETCEILKKSISIILKPVTDTFIFARNYYHRSASFFEPEEAKTMLLLALNWRHEVSSYEEPDEMILDVALKKLNFLELVIQLPPIQLTDMVRNEEEIFSDSYKMQKFIFLSDYFYGKIKFILDTMPEEDPQDSIIKVYFFVLHKFTDYFQSIENQRADLQNISELLNSGQSFLGRKKFTEMCTILNDIKRREIFDEIIEKFQNEEYLQELVVQYCTEMADVTNLDVELWKNIVAEDGLKIYNVVVDGYNTQDDYKALVARLFDLPEHEINFITQSDDIILLRCDSKYIELKFTENRSEALIISVDSSVNVEVIQPEEEGAE